MLQAIYELVSLKLLALSLRLTLAQTSFSLWTFWTDICRHIDKIIIYVSLWNVWKQAHTCLVQPLIAVGLVLFPNSFSFNQLCSFNKTAEWLNLWLKSCLTFMSTYLFALSAVKWQLNSAMLADGAQKRFWSARSKMGTCSTQQCPSMYLEIGEGGKRRINLLGAAVITPLMFGVFLPLTFRHQTTHTSAGHFFFFFF